MATNIKKKNLWSNSLTKNELITYAEGLAYKNFDQRIICNIRRDSLYTWLILKTGAGLKSPSLDQSQKLYYDRVRRVTIDNKLYMFCDCGYIQRYLMPCAHMCDVIKNLEFLVPSICQIKWHKIFNYYHGSSFGLSLATNVCNTLDKVLKITRENCYKSSGKNKGIPLSGTAFLNCLKPFIDSNFSLYDPVYDLMIIIQNKTLERGPVIKNSLQLNDYRSTIVDEYVSHLPFCTEDLNHGLNSLGELSQVK